MSPPVLSAQLARAQQAEIARAAAKAHGDPATGRQPGRSWALHPLRLIARAAS
jgi:hypothetical protein